MQRQQVHPMYGALTIGYVAAVALVTAASLREKLNVGTTYWQSWQLVVILVGGIMLATIFVPMGKSRWMNTRAHKVWTFGFFGSMLFGGIAWWLSVLWSNWIVLVIAAALIAVLALVLARFFLTNSRESETTRVSA